MYFKDPYQTARLYYLLGTDRLTGLVSLVVSFMASFVLSFFPLDVLDGIWDLLFAWLSLVVSMVMSFCAVLFPTRCLG